MAEPSERAEAFDRFAAMVRDFLDEFSIGEVTTWDFKSVVERHMTPRMDAAGDGTLDWFFDAWVFGSGLPRFQADTTVEESVDGFVVRGRLLQSGADLSVPVPVYGERESGELTYLGDVLADGSDSELFLFAPFRPDRIRLDPDSTILTR
jgi:hypothetical protein